MLTPPHTVVTVAEEWLRLAHVPSSITCTNDKQAVCLLLALAHGNVNLFDNVNVTLVKCIYITITTGEP